jgi:hypothetical protein
MGDKDVLMGWVLGSKVLSVTEDPSGLLLSVLRLVSAVYTVVGEEVIPWGAGLVEESVVVKIEEGKSVETDEGRLSAMVDKVARPGLDSVLE